jgi:HSP20 family protein
LIVAETPVEVKKSAPAASSGQDVWSSFRSEMDRLFDRFSGSFNMAPFRRMFELTPSPRLQGSFELAVPAVDITEDTNAFKVTAELPGMAEKDVEVNVSGDVLTIKGEKRQEKEEKDNNYHMSERSYGMVERSFTLPKGVDSEKISAEFGKGVLTLTLPKRPEAQTETKKIDIKATS